MPEIRQHAPGSFCWVELATTDQSAAKNFYHSLFGWTSNDFPMGPGETYTMFRLRDRDTGGGYMLNQQMREQHIPPHWMLYIAVDSADATAEKAKQAGAETLAAPFDVMDVGRMAVLRDTSGAVFSIWEPKRHAGIGIHGEPGTLCWADLSTADVGRAAKFYREVFDWDISPGEDVSGYLHIKNGSDFIGGIPPASARNPNVPPHWLLYFYVTDCDHSTRTAKELGARIHLGPTTMENVGRMTVLSDPQGATFSLFQPMRRG
jgi:predicted enzyme related to lactoylglutathione lyase